MCYLALSIAMQRKKSSNIYRWLAVEEIWGSSKQKLRQTEELMGITGTLTAMQPAVITISCPFKLHFSISKVIIRSK